LPLGCGRPERLGRRRSRDRAVLEDANLDVGGVAGHGFVDRVVDDFPDEVVQAAASVEPMYMPGRRRTGSRPSRTWMLSAL
jgi:hypothetical protein